MDEINTTVGCECLQVQTLENKSVALFVMYNRVVKESISNKAKHQIFRKGELICMNYQLCKSSGSGRRQSKFSGSKFSPN